MCCSVNWDPIFVLTLIVYTYKEKTINTLSIKISLSVITLVVLAGCGSSNPTVTQIESRSATTVTVFSDGSGVARDISEDVAMVIMTGDIQSGVNNANSSGNAVNAVDLSNVSYQSSNTFGQYSSGPATINGSPVNVSAYESFSGGVSIVYAGSSSGSLIMAGGSPVSNIPAGSFTYTGNNIIGNRDSSYSEDGSFTMNVNFSTGDAAISGSTANSTFGGNGISVNTSDGTFSDSNITMSTNGDPSVSATITGQFHGNGATGVTGIYHDNSSNPLTVGIFAGER